MRTDISQLPAQQELSEIINREAKRLPPTGKESIHYPDFSSLIRLLEYHGLPTTIYTTPITTGQVHSGELMMQAEQLNEALSQHILRNETPQVMIDAVFDYLSESDEPQLADIIFVFGNKNMERIIKAVELFKQGLAPLLVLSGGHPFYAPAETPEAIVYKNYALEQGVPEKNIITETKSITIPDNIKSSLNLLDSLNQKYSKMILVNSPYPQRRGWCCMMKLCAPNTTLFRINADPGANYSKTTWFKQSKSIKAVLHEYAKMQIGVVLNSA